MPWALALAATAAPDSLLIEAMTSTFTPLDDHAVGQRGELLLVALGVLDVRLQALGLHGRGEQRLVEALPAGRAVGLGEDHADLGRAFWRGRGTRGRRARGGGVLAAGGEREREPQPGGGERGAPDTHGRPSTASGTWESSARAGRRRGKCCDRQRMGWSDVAPSILNRSRSETQVTIRSPDHEFVANPHPRLRPSPIGRPCRRPAELVPGRLRRRHSARHRSLTVVATRRCRAHGSADRGAGVAVPRAQHHGDDHRGDAGRLQRPGNLTQRHQADQRSRSPGAARAAPRTGPGRPGAARPGPARRAPRWTARRPRARPAAPADRPARPARRAGRAAAAGTARTAATAKPTAISSRPLPALATRLPSRM